MLVICQECRKKDKKDIMRKVTTGKKAKTNKYYHFNCYEKHLKEQEFRDKERKELDELYETIKRIYDIPENEILPSQLFPFLQELRNGSIAHGRIKKAFKKGVKYSALNLTYQFCESKIKYAKNNKEFKSFLAELKYGLAIVRNNLENAKRDYQKRKRAAESKQNVKTHINMMKDINTELRKKKKKQNIAQEAKKKDEVDVTSLFE